MDTCDYCGRKVRKEDLTYYKENDVIVLALCKDKDKDTCNTVFQAALKGAQT